MVRCLSGGSADLGLALVQVTGDGGLGVCKLYDADSVTARLKEIMDTHKRVSFRAAASLWTCAVERAVVLTIGRRPLCAVCVLIFAPGGSVLPVDACFEGTVGLWIPAPGAPQLHVWDVSADGWMSDSVVTCAFGAMLDGRVWVRVAVGAGF